MKRLHSILFCVLALAGCATPPAGPVPAASGGGLIVPESASARAYLGLAGPAGRPFTLDEIKADVLVIDCFDMYCHVCQSQAGRAKALEARLGPQARLIGLGVGNTPLETRAFATKFGLTFPCFSDRSNAIARRFGKPRLPGLVVLKREGGSFRFVRTTNGIPADPAEVMAGR